MANIFNNSRILLTLCLDKPSTYIPSLSSPFSRICKDVDAANDVDAVEL